MSFMDHDDERRGGPGVVNTGSGAREPRGHIISRCVACGAQLYPSPEAHTPGCYQSKINRLRKALGDILGGHTAAELDQLRAGLLLLEGTMPPEDFAMSNRAIDVMLEIGS
jgi:hypothetical protein